MDATLTGSRNSQKSILALAIQDQIYLQELINKKGFNQSIQTSKVSTSLKFDETGEGIAVGDEEGSLTIYDTEHGRKIRTIKEHTGRISAIDWSVKQPYHIVTGSQDRCICNHDIRVKNSLINIIGSHEGEITNIQLTGNKMVCSSFEDKLLAIWQNILTDPNAQST